MDRKDTGAVGEKLAQDLLKKRGYRILDTNARCGRGEIDIVCRRGTTAVFVEVRTKTSVEFGTPEESITPAKRERLKRLAHLYRESHPDLPSQWRIDVVAVELDRLGRLSRIEHIENAVTDG